MKVYPELVFNKCLFYDEEPFEIKNENECFHCNNCINSHCNHNSTFLNSIENKYKKSMISLNELNNKKNTLKKNTKINNSNSNPIPVKKKFIPSLNDILNAKNKLNKLNIKKKI